MVNVPVLESYMKKKAYTWEGLNKDVGGLPPTIEDFAATFEDSATADQITVISNYLRIPSYAIGSVFFAPAIYDGKEKPHLAPLEDMGDVIVDLYRQFTLRERHRIFDIVHAYHSGVKRWRETGMSCTEEIVFKRSENEEQRKQRWLKMRNE